MAQLSNRYAAAVYELAAERDTISDCLDQATFLADVLAGKDCQLILTHPRISSEEKKSFLDEAFKQNVNNELMGLLYLLVDKGREEYVVSILTEFIDMAKRKLRKATAEVVSAFPLKKEQEAQLAALLSRKLDKKVDVEVKVNSSVIGGLYIQVDGYYMDRTVKTRLQEIKHEMLQA